MAVTRDQVRAKVGTTAADDEVIDAALATIRVLLDAYLEDAIDGAEAVPVEIYDRAHLSATVEMFNQDKAPNGVLNQVYDYGDGTQSSTPVRIGADPLRPAYPLLARWMPGATVGGLA